MGYDKASLHGWMDGWIESLKNVTQRMLVIINPVASFVNQRKKIYIIELSLQSTCMLYPSDLVLQIPFYGISFMSTRQSAYQRPRFQYISKVTKPPQSTARPLPLHPYLPLYPSLSALSYPRIRAAVPFELPSQTSSSLTVTDGHLEAKTT